MGANETWTIRIDAKSWCITSALKQSMYYTSSTPRTKTKSSILVTTKDKKKQKNCIWILEVLEDALCNNKQSTSHENVPIYDHQLQNAQQLWSYWNQNENVKYFANDTYLETFMHHYHFNIYAKAQIKSQP